MKQMPNQVDLVNSYSDIKKIKNFAQTTDKENLNVRATIIHIIGTYFFFYYLAKLSL